MSGEIGSEKVTAAFAAQAKSLAAAGADALLIETMSDLAEVEAAVRAAQAVAAGVPIVATLSFDTHLRTMMGVTPSAAVLALGALGVAAVGANCGRGPGEMETIIGQMAGARPDGLLLIAQSNAGLPQLVGDHFEIRIRLRGNVIRGSSTITPRSSS